ncbi:hypothetical protein NDU88_003740 [Pleurodeles waltl]|uniref:Uncharacterized protein n=1 Tax=Pleurodeles waltl TaxID=8319 RepID=A0AAV7RG36_PLEWA|nr:hypothetical protein NDU88_003740 [Pleurodeles waltl]
MPLQCRYIVSFKRGCRRRLRPAGELPQHWEVSLVGTDALRLRYAAAILLSVPPGLSRRSSNTILLGL